MFPRFRRRMLQAVALLVLGACSTPLPVPDAALTSADPPDLRAGAPVLLDTARADNAIAAIALGTGELRVLYRRKDTREVRDVVLSPDGRVRSNDAIPAALLGDRKPSAALPELDLALDGAAVVHALVRGRHLAWRNGGWVVEQGSPCEAFIQGGASLMCVGRPPQGDAPQRRTDWWVLPGLVVPVAGDVDKFAAWAQEAAGWRLLGVFDAASKLDTMAVQAVATRGGDVHALLITGRFMLSVQDCTRHFESIPGGTAQAPAAPTRLQGAADSWAVHCAALRPQTGSLALDPVTDNGLLVLSDWNDMVVMQRAFERGSYGPPTAIYAGHKYMGAWVAHLGRERFGVLLDEQGQSSYGVLQQGRWSRAERIGSFNTWTRFGGAAPLLGLRERRMALVAIDAQSRPVVVWFEPVRSE